MYVGIAQNTGNKYVGNEGYVMEDAVGLGKNTVAVADGHGSRGGSGGKQSAEIAVYHACLGKKITQIHNIVSNSKTSETQHAGCTLTVGCVKNNNILKIKQVGDSSALLYSNGEVFGWLIEPHNKINSSEKQRMREEGHLLTRMGFKVNGRYINVTRAIGHNDLMHEGDEVSLKLEDGEFCIIATDGLWDYITNQRIIELLKSTACPSCAASQLMENRIKKNKMDNAAVVIVGKTPSCERCQNIKLYPSTMFEKGFGYVRRLFS